MSIVAGVDFGTLSVRVTLVDSKKGPIGTASASYPLHRRHEDPNYATQAHADQMAALAKASREVLKVSGVAGSAVESIALDTTGSSVIPVGEGLEPLDEYYLWCDHRAFAEAEEITRKAHELNFEGIQWCGGVYSHEWGFAKLLHWLRHNPEKRARFVTALEHCDMVAATLCGVKDVSQLKRSICSMGHKWMWNPKWGGLPPEEFLVAVDPLFKGVRAKLGGEYLTSDHLAGHLSEKWATELGLKAGIPIPVGAFDAHWDAIGSNIREGDVVNDSRRLRRGAGQRASAIHGH
jgi:L-ribulokinase